MHCLKFSIKGKLELHFYRTLEKKSIHCVSLTKAGLSNLIHLKILVLLKITESAVSNRLSG